MSDLPNPLYDLSALVLLRWHGLHAHIGGNGSLMVGPSEKIDNDVRAFIAMKKYAIKLELEVEAMPKVPGW